MDETPMASARRAAGGLRFAGHAIVFDKEAPRQGYQLTFARMIDGLPADNARRDMRTMFLDVVAEVGLRLVRTGHQDLIDIRQRIAHLAEKLVLGDRKSTRLNSSH